MYSLNSIVRLLPLKFSVPLAGKEVSTLGAVVSFGPPDGVDREAQLLSIRSETSNKTKKPRAKKGIIFRIVRQ